MRSFMHVIVIISGVVILSIAAAAVVALGILMVLAVLAYLFSW